MSTTELPGDPPSADEIHAAMKLRLALLKPLVKEYDQRVKADAAIDKALKTTA